MRKILIFFMLAMSIMAVAQEDTVPDLAPGGDPIYSLVIEDMLIPKPLTTINNNLCSSFPDSGASYTPSSTNIKKYCRTAKHTGEAFQLFLVRSDGSYSYLGEKQLSEGQKACFDVQYGKNYHYDIYYCQENQRTCTDFTSECHEYTRELRVRSCSDTGSEKLWVNQRVDLNAPRCPGTLPPVGSKPQSPTEPVPPSPDGSYFVAKPVANKGRLAVNEKLLITQDFYAAKAGNYLLEAGVEKVGPLSAIGISTNSCNPEDGHYSSRMVRLEQGTHQLSFTVKPAEGEGRYVYHTALVTSCGGNVLLQSNSDQTIIVADDQKQDSVFNFSRSAMVLMVLGGVIGIISVALLWYAPAYSIVGFIIGIILFLIPKLGGL